MERPGLIAGAGKACGTAMLALAVAGCTVGPNYAPPSSASLGVPPAFHAAVEAQASEADLASWWRAFDDPMLDWLVTRAIAGNLDIDAAGARLRQARAATRSARAALFPTLGVSAGVTQDWQRNGSLLGSSSGGTRFNAGLDAAYEVDLFGGVRRGIEAARADQQSSEASLRDVQRSIVAEIGLDYVSAREAQARLAIARANLAAQDETLQIVGWRVQAGLASGLDLEQARQLRAQTAATIPTLETAYAQAVNALGVLIGEAPGGLRAQLDPVQPIPLGRTLLAADPPANVIARRPDVKAAERTLAAETARIGVQEAQLYPALQLSGSLGGNASQLGNIFQFAAGSLVGAITAPIFEGGAIRARIEGQRAAAAAAYASYRQTVLIALEDVENALVALSSANRREVDLATAAAAARNAVTFARSQYQAGLIDFQSLLDSERTSLSSEDALAAARSDRASGLIQLYKALGGGWQAAPLPASAAPGAPIMPAAAASASAPTPTRSTRN